MKKHAFITLALITTTRCNLNCGHCLLGDRKNNDMSDEIIEATLNQTAYASTLTICGGENTLILNRLEKIITYIIEKRINIDELTITINGTIYTPELFRLLEEIDNYIGKEIVNATFAISLDKYHLSEIKRLGIYAEFLENFKRYKESKYFYGTRGIDIPPFREGNAILLPKETTVPLRPTKKYLTYLKNGKFDKNGICLIGPDISVNPSGTITECDASCINQEIKYNYGNVLNDSFEETILKNGAHILKPKRFLKATQKEWKRFCTYTK
ncbi:MAG: radical SAM protein [Bacilli bacterium]|nr:radical SAM protein [Bacilli bacterium]